MQFIKKIRQDLGFTSYQMSKNMGMKSVREYLNFEASKNAVNVKKMIKLWELSGLSAQSFLELMRKEFFEFKK